MSSMRENKIQCHHCGYTQIDYDFISVLPVPLPPEKLKIIDFLIIPMDGQIPIKYSIKRNHDVLLSDCLFELSLLSPGTCFVEILRDSSPLKTIESVTVYEINETPTIYPKHICLNIIPNSTFKKSVVVSKGTTPINQKMKIEMKEQKKNKFFDESFTPKQIPVGSIDKDEIVAIHCLNRIHHENKIKFFNSSQTSLISIPFVLTFSMKELTKQNIIIHILRHFRLQTRKLFEEVFDDDIEILMSQPMILDIEQMILDGEEELPFTLRVTSFDGKNCFACPWHKDCCGCELTDDILQQYDFNEYTFTLCIDWKSESLTKFDTSLADLVIRDESVVNTRKDFTKPMTLQECYQLLSIPEYLSKNEYKCPQCHGFHSAKKTSKLVTLPHYLIFQIKRFITDDNKTFRSSADVTFPLTDLSAKEFFDTDIDCVFDDDIYDLYAVINCVGDTSSRHFTTYCKIEENRWLKFDDKNVSEITESSVQSNNAYILFYEKRNTNVHSIREKYMPLPRDKQSAGCVLL